MAAANNSEFDVMLPSLIVMNINSLKNKGMPKSRDEQRTNHGGTDVLNPKLTGDYADVDCIVITETLLGEGDYHTDYLTEESLQRFHVSRFDRNKFHNGECDESCPKKHSKSGGLMLLVNKAWCPNRPTVQEVSEFYNRNNQQIKGVELLSVRCQPAAEQLPEGIEFINVIAAYVGSNLTLNEKSRSQEFIARTLTNTDGAARQGRPFVLAGDFNQLALNDETYFPPGKIFSYIPTNIATRRASNTLDQVYSNVRQAYDKVTPLDRIGNQDHIPMKLTPTKAKFLSWEVKLQQMIKEQENQLSSSKFWWKAAARAETEEMRKQLEKCILNNTSNT